MTTSERRIGISLLAASLLFILFAGTFPFDFVFDARAMTHFDWRLLEYDPGFVDRGQNILFFMPFGFALASVIGPRKFRAIARIIAGFVGGCLLSVLIESAQMFVSFRDPSMMDVWANTLGGALGACVFAVIGEPALRYLGRAVLFMKPLFNFPVVATITVAYVAIQLAAPILIRDPGDLSVWDNELPLVIGNELTGDRPWSGEISQVLLADRAATAEQVRKLSEGIEPAEIFGESLLGDYRLNGSGPFEDRAGKLPPLQWAGEPGKAPTISPEHWLMTVPVTWANDRIRKSSQFTFAATVTTFDLGQRGPARLASISGDTTHRNVQLGQEFADLSIRVRTATRSMPDMYVLDVFAANVPRQIAITAADAQIIVYIDGQERSRVRITPEAKVIWRLYPREGFRLRMERYGFASYALIYRLMVFMPLAALLGVLAAQTRLTLKYQWWPAASIVGFAIILELILGPAINNNFSVQNLAIDLGVGLCALVALNRIRVISE